MDACSIERENDIRSTAQKWLSVTEWERGIPLRHIFSRDHSGTLCVCQIRPFGFVCTICGHGQEIHPGLCESCGAEIILDADWPRYHEMIRERERHLYEQERLRTYR